MLLNVKIYRLVLNLLTLGMLLTTPFTAMSIEAAMYSSNCGSICCCTGMDRAESADGLSSACNCRMNETPAMPPAERGIVEKPQIRINDPMQTSAEEDNHIIAPGFEPGIIGVFYSSNYKPPPIYLSNHSFLN
ncbi:MAG: hypothetical protein GF307_01630 [candidate division Zixibacteria bacterium]|nr:hypothetical protein [candidate division Zixibacteria bacterium]